MTIRKKVKGGGILNKDSKSQRITDEILSAEYDALYHYVLSLCRNEALAQDITQETFLQAIKSSDKFHGESSLYTWLCAIAKRRLINRYKKEKREIPSEDFSCISSEGKRSPEELISDKDTAMYIHKILHTMNEPYKEVFSLRVFGQLSFGNIAKLFVKTESWARVTYHRATKMIKEKLREEGYYG
ncbi:MAG: RNA polymerase sigma factor [Clostridia bacterium]|nr:RNA polymerase sigma factor [Clostridia bacterium]